MSTSETYLSRVKQLLKARQVAGFTEAQVHEALVHMLRHLQSETPGYTGLVEDAAQFSKAFESNRPKSEGTVFTHVQLHHYITQGLFRQLHTASTEGDDPFGRTERTRYVLKKVIAPNHSIGDINILVEVLQKGKWKALHRDEQAAWEQFWLDQKNGVLSWAEPERYRTIYNRFHQKYGEVDAALLEQTLMIFGFDLEKLDEQVRKYLEQPTVQAQHVVSPATVEGNNVTTISGQAKKLPKTRSFFGWRLNQRQLVVRLAVILVFLSLSVFLIFSYPSFVDSYEAPKGRPVVTAAQLFTAPTPVSQTTLTTSPPGITLTTDTALAESWRGWDGLRAVKAPVVRYTVSNFTDRPCFIHGLLITAQEPVVLAGELESISVSIQGIAPPIQVLLDCAPGTQVQEWIITSEDRRAALPPMTKRSFWIRYTMNEACMRPIQAALSVKTPDSAFWMTTRKEVLVTK